ncbi:hypothetical protein PARHAE_00737 [Paracoccus haematequi]|uniref:DUF1376 domain-containing protein n=1 Tax=Paracoccus haematequi TaxID=2491866 RepID=A0A447IJB0_9RHOB|nr:DUF1376 domain-containing protein [Paracoccus haematequi]VDS07560.1 hypothetical protein PARHAE_00737 [Paracoccus haematequi]
MSAYYKMDPADWDFRTAELSLEEEAALLRIINAIHKHDQPVPNNDRVLAGLFRCSTRKARTLLNALIEAGELRIEDGRITNDKAISDIVQRGSVSGSRAESGAKGGRKRAENAAKALSDNESGQAIASSRIEENRIEYGGGGSACARETVPSSESLSVRERILIAMGLGADGVVGPSKFIGTPSDVAEANRWLAMPGMSIEAVEAEIASIMRGKTDGPPSRFSYFTNAMTRLSAALSAPPLRAAEILPLHQNHARPTGHGIRAQIPEKYRQ